MTTPLSELIDLELTGRATPEQSADLAARITSDPAASRAYVRATFLHAQLRQSLNTRTTKPDLSPATARIPTPSKPRGAAQRTPGVKLTYTLAAAVTLAAATLALYFFVFSNPQSETPNPRSSTPLATLIETTGGKLTTPHDYASEGRQYAAGNYTLDAGSAEFMLTNSVNVRLHGQTRLSMHTDMSVSLAYGNARFVVPPGAVGFTVHLPDGTKIVDLGTVFHVRVDDSGRARIAVLDGRVQIVQGEHRLPLGAGEGGLVDRDTPQRTEAILADDVIANPGFEQPAKLTGHLPRKPGHWTAEGANVVEAEQGITPYDGKRMLRINQTDVRGRKGYGGAEVYHAIDLRPYRDLIDDGRLSIRAEARFNRVAGDRQTDTGMALVTFTHRGDLARFDTKQGKLKSDRIETDADTTSWETATVTAAIPTGTDYLIVELLALENVFNDKSGVELDGHYADGVNVRLIVRPANDNPPRNNPTDLDRAPTVPTPDTTPPPAPAGQGDS